MSKETTFCTVSGGAFDVIASQPHSVVLTDIAMALSRIARFGGHTVLSYSVARHALLVADLVEEQTSDPFFVLTALHHDDHEAYTGDIISPVKRAIETLAGFGVIKGLQSELDKSIGEKLGIPHSSFDSPLIQYADQRALWMEHWALQPLTDREVWGSEPEWGSNTACEVNTRLASQSVDYWAFINRHYELENRIMNIGKVEGSDV